MPGQDARRPYRPTSRPPDPGKGSKTVAVLYHPPPDTHALYLDQTPTGADRIAVARAGRRKNRPGRRILALTGRHRDIAWPALSQILYQHTGRRLRPRADDIPPGEYHPVNEYCANQLLLAMHAVKESKTSGRGQTLAAAIAQMHDCEAGWWYALFANRHRPRKVLQALELLYA